MISFVDLNSNSADELNSFLSKFYNTNMNITKKSWQKKFSNPIEIAELIGTFIDNIDDYHLTLWISLDTGIIIKIDKSNANEIIKYLYERFPY